MKRRYEYRVEARKKRSNLLVTAMTCWGDNKMDAICHATQWWMTQEHVDYQVWCKITATRTGNEESLP